MNRAPSLGIIQVRSRPNPHPNHYKYSLRPILVFLDQSCDQHLSSSQVLGIILFNLFLSGHVIKDRHKPYVWHSKFTPKFLCNHFYANRICHKIRLIGRGDSMILPYSITRLNSVSKNGKSLQNKIIGEYHIRLYHLIIGRHTLECNI